MKRFLEALLGPFDANPPRRQGALLLYVASTYPMVILVGLALSLVGLDWVASILALPFLFVYGPAMGLALIAGIFSFPRGDGIAGIFRRGEPQGAGDKTALPPALGIIPRAMWTVAVVACLTVVALMFLSFYDVAWGVFVFGFFPAFTILGATGATLAAVHVQRATSGK